MWVAAIADTETREMFLRDLVKFFDPSWISGETGRWGVVFVVGVGEHRITDGN